MHLHTNTARVTKRVCLFVYLLALWSAVPFVKANTIKGRCKQWAGTTDSRAGKQRGEQKMRRDICWSMVDVVWGPSVLPQLPCERQQEDTHTNTPPVFGLMWRSAAFVCLCVQQCSVFFPNFLQPRTERQVKRESLRVNVKRIDLIFLSCVGWCWNLPQVSCLKIRAAMLLGNLTSGDYQVWVLSGLQAPVTFGLGLPVLMCWCAVEALKATCRGTTTATLAGTLWCQEDNVHMSVGQMSDKTKEEPLHTFNSKLLTVCGYNNGFSYLIKTYPNMFCLFSFRLEINQRCDRFI